MSTQTDAAKYLQSISEAYKSTTTSTSKLCRTIVFAIIAAIWVLFQQNGTFSFPELPTRAIGLFGIYIILDVLQYFSSATSYFILYSLRKRLGSNIGKWQHKVDSVLYMVFLAKILYLLIVMTVCIYSAFHMNISDLYNPPK